MVQNESIAILWEGAGDSGQLEKNSKDTLETSRRLCGYFLIAAAGLFVLAGGLLYGQVITSAVVGNVTDTTGAAVLGAIYFP